MMKLTYVSSTRSSPWESYLSWLKLTFLRFLNFPSKLRLASQLWTARDKSAWSPSSYKSQPTKRSWERRLTLTFSVWMQFNSLAKWLVRAITSVHRHLQKCSTTTWIVMLTRWLKNRKVKWMPSLKTSIQLTRCFISKLTAPRLLEATRLRWMTWWARISTCKTAVTSISSKASTDV